MANSVTATAYPTATNDATESKLESWMSPHIPDGVVWGSGNELACFADSTGMIVKLPSGSHMIGGVRGDLASQTSLDIAAANSTNPRIDTVVAELTRTPSPYVIKFRVVTGTAASSPVAPTLTNNATTRQIAIADVRVDASVTTIAAAKVTLKRTLTGDTGWFSWTPTFSVTSGAGFTISTLNVFGRARYDGMTCHFHVEGTIAMGGSNPGGIVMSLPNQAANENIPIQAIMDSDARYAKTRFNSFKATECDIYTIGGANWETDGVQRAFGISGTFEVYPH